MSVLGDVIDHDRHKRIMHAGHNDKRKCAGKQNHRGNARMIEQIIDADRQVIPENRAERADCDQGDRHDDHKRKHRNGNQFQR